MHLTPQHSAKLCKEINFFFLYNDLNGAKFKFFAILYHGWCHRLNNFSQLNIVDSCKTQRCHQSLFGWDSKGKTHTPGKQSHMGEKASVFEAWVNEALLLIWGAEERMSEWMPVMLTDTPADGSFHSKDKCYITAGASKSNNSCRLRWEAMKWIVKHSTCLRTVLFWWSSGNTEKGAWNDVWSSAKIKQGNKTQTYRAEILLQIQVRKSVSVNYRTLGVN